MYVYSFSCTCCGTIFCYWTRSALYILPVNTIDDFVYEEELYQNESYDILDLDDYIVDVDEIVMNQDDNLEFDGYPLDNDFEY